MRRSRPAAQTPAAAGLAGAAACSRPRHRRTAAPPARDRRRRRRPILVQLRRASVKPAARCAASNPTSNASGTQCTTSSSAKLPTHAARRASAQHRHRGHIAKQHQPHPVAQHPERTKQQRCEREAVAHEYEALWLRRRGAGPQWRLVNRVDGHGFLAGLVQQPMKPSRILQYGVVESGQPPSLPLVEGTSLAARASIATAARSARARPLKQDSAI